MSKEKLIHDFIVNLKKNKKFYGLDSKLINKLIRLFQRKEIILNINAMKMIRKFNKFHKQLQDKNSRLISSQYGKLISITKQHNHTKRVYKNRVEGGLKLPSILNLFKKPKKDVKIDFEAIFNEISETITSSNDENIKNLYNLLSSYELTYEENLLILLWYITDTYKNERYDILYNKLYNKLQDNNLIQYFSNHFNKFNIIHYGMVVTPDIIISEISSFLDNYFKNIPRLVRQNGQHYGGGNIKYSKRFRTTRRKYTF